MAGAKMGLQECVKQFKYEPWNCFVAKNIKIMPIVNRARLPLGKLAGAVWSTDLNIKHCNSNEFVRIATDFNMKLMCWMYYPQSCWVKYWLF